MTKAAISAVLLRWQGGASLRAIARETGLDRKTIRRYLAVLRTMRFERWMTVDDEVVHAIAVVMRRRRARVSATQHALEVRRERILRCLAARLSLATIHAVLLREGLRVSYATFRRFAITELGWRARPTRALAA
jgi:transposase